MKPSLHDSDRLHKHTVTVNQSVLWYAYLLTFLLVWFGRYPLLTSDATCVTFPL